MKKILIFALVVIMLFSFAGCIEVVEGVSQEKYDELKAAYDEVVAERDALLQGKDYVPKVDGVGDESKVATDEYLVRTVAELLDELDANALNATDSYTKRNVEITGRVEVIDASGKYISLYPSDALLSFAVVKCYVKTNEQKEAIKNISNGDIVTIKGEITSVNELTGYKLDIHSINSNRK